MMASLSPGGHVGFTLSGTVRGHQDVGAHTSKEGCPLHPEHTGPEPAHRLGVGSWDSATVTEIQATAVPQEKPAPHRQGAWCPNTENN